MKLHHVAAVTLLLLLMVVCECRHIRSSYAQEHANRTDLNDNCTENPFFASRLQNTSGFDPNSDFDKGPNVSICIQTDVGLTRRNRVIFKCDTSGSYRDEKNCGAYWNCDVDGAGGFIAVRKKCPSDHVFNPKFGRCMYRYDRLCLEGDCQKESACNQKYKCFSEDIFAAANRPPPPPPTTKRTTTESATDMTKKVGGGGGGKGESGTAVSSSCGNKGPSSEKSNYFSEVLFPKTPPTEPTEKADFEVTANKFYGGAGADLDENDNSSISLVHGDAAGSAARKGEGESHLLLDNSSTTMAITTTTLLTTTEQAFMCMAEGTFTDPQSCTNFYLCHPRRGAPSALEALKIQCPSGTAFDGLLGKCTKEALDACYARQTPATYRAKKSAKLHKVAPTENTYTCKDVGRFADENDCSSYHLCFVNSEGGLGSMRFECPTDMLFDTDDSWCRPSRRVTCNGRPH